MLGSLSRLSIAAVLASLALAPLAAGEDTPCPSLHEVLAKLLPPGTFASDPLYADDEPPSVYAPPAPPRPESGENQGGVHFDIRVLYVSDYVYRGLLHGPLGPDSVGNRGQVNENFDGKLSFDFGKLPHPWVGLFVNIDNSDDVSRFQEIRPKFGADWEIRPLLITVGDNTYIYPERENLFNTDEVFVRIELNDSNIFRTENPIFSPYIYAAYDYDRFHGFYFEFGIHHDFPVEETGLTISPAADVAYVNDDHEFAQHPGGSDSGFQHFDAGLNISYSLNHLLNISKRYGDFTLVGEGYFTNGIDGDLKHNSIIWGGGGIAFHY